MENSVKICNGEYEVCRDGRVLSHKRKSVRELIGKTTGAGYKMIILTISEKKKYVNVHRLIASCFIPNPQNLPEVNHIDGNKLNNQVENLEWVTTRQNQLHAIAMGVSSRLKLSYEKAERIRELFKYMTKI